MIATQFIRFDTINGRIWYTVVDSYGREVGYYADLSEAAAAVDSLTRKARAS